MTLSPWMSDLGICLGMTLLAFACFSSENIALRRCGIWVLFATLGVALWLCTENGWVVFAGLSAWFLVPVAQAVYMSRKLSFPARRHLKEGDLSQTEFPEVQDITRDLRDLDFTLKEDYWLDPSPIEQGYRLFSHASEPIYGSIAIVKPGTMHLTYVIFATPGSDGSVWLTWDYPLAYGLKMPPHFKVYRCLEAETVEELLEQHREFLKVNDVDAASAGPVSPAQAAPFFEQLFGSTISYNVHMGLLKPTKRGADEMGYSWRGTAFISWQVLRELVFG